MTEEERAMAVLLRRVEWLISELAHHLPAGRVSAGKRNECADLLAEAVRLLRIEIPVVIDATVIDNPPEIEGNHDVQGPRQDQPCAWGPRTRDAG